MKLKTGQRVAFYEVTGLSDPPPRTDAVLGTILVDRPRGETTSWDFLNIVDGSTGWIAGKRLGFARVDSLLRPIPEPALQAVLDARKSVPDDD